jgi:hypothetical protein
MLFDDNLSSRILKFLNGARGCWDQRKLAGLASSSVSPDRRKVLISGSGTNYFWGVDAKGRRFPLTLVKSSWEAAKLVGFERNGKLREYLFTPADICEYLRQKQIFPSLFTSYAVISLARGLGCVGGYFQSDYLPLIQQGLLSALSCTPGYEEYCRPVSLVPTDYYLSGMMCGLVYCGSNRAVPAGPLEIIARGGLQRQYLENLKSLTVGEAHDLGLFNIYPDVMTLNERMLAWQEGLSAEAGGFGSFIIE